ARFQVGHRDLAVHLHRPARLDGGATLSETTARLCAAFGIRHPVVPMSDQPVSTIIETAGGDLPFQHYFVREQCRPAISGYRFAGVEGAAPTPGFAAALDDPPLAAILISPPNPFVSVSPILAIPGVRARIRASGVPVIAVSPSVAGTALRGPAAKLFSEVSRPVSSRGVAEFYGVLRHPLGVDQADLGEPLATPCRVHHCPPVMQSL